MNKLSNLKTSEKVQVALWFLTLVQLFIFVIVAATVGSGANADPNANAAAGLVFALLLIAAFLTTVFLQVAKKAKKGRDK